MVQEIKLPFAQVCEGGAVYLVAHAVDDVVVDLGHGVGGDLVVVVDFGLRPQQRSDRLDQVRVAAGERRRCHQPGLVELFAALIHGFPQRGGHVPVGDHVELDGFGAAQKRHAGMVHEVVDSLHQAGAAERNIEVVAA